MTTQTLTQSRYTLDPIMRQIFRALFAVNTVILIVLPTGSILSFNIKIFLFLIMVPLVFAVELLDQNPHWSRFAVITAIPLTVCLWVVVALFQGGDVGLALLEAKDIVATIAGAWFISIYCAQSTANVWRFLRLVLFSVTATAVLKVLILVYSVMTGTPISVFVKLISTLFNVDLMTADIGDAGLGRFELFSDGLIPLCVFALFCLRSRLSLNTWKSVAIALLLFASTLMSFSRYLWAYTLLALVLGYCCSKWERLQYIFLALGTICVASTFDILYQIVALRFSDALAGSSDLDRVVQGHALLEFFLSAPILGHGLGSYTAKVIRSDALPYSYENQIGALAGQVGLVGCFLLLVLIVYYLGPMWRGSHSWRYRLSLLILLVAWLYGGFLNPQLISSVASVSYGCLLALSLAPEREIGRANV